MRKIIDGSNITLGCCYYPEHWDKVLWADDLKRMLECGITTIRVAEFAWSKVEPAEGNFTYEFFDEFLNLSDEMGMQVIMGTPTATPPAWLTEKYPDVLNGNRDGVLFRHGLRRHYNYNSENYKRLSSRIVEKFAEHYGKRNCVIGWQIDNELNCEVNEFYSESDDRAFKAFVREKYKTLNALNDAWGTVFWNQTFTDFEEVHIPRPTTQGNVNPHLMLDYYRFISDSTCKFAKMQADIIRKYKKEDDFITTNGLFSHIDYQRMRDESLDFITYDSYPNFAYCIEDYDPADRGLRDRKWSRNLTETRAISRVFGIMEQQSGANGWDSRMNAPTPRPGQITLWSMQSIAHGADFISYFRWRTATFGTEMYWHGILDYSGRDNRRLSEISSFSKELKKISEAAGSIYEAKVAVLKDYDNIYDSEYDTWHRDVERVSQNAVFGASQRTHTPIDFVYLTKGLTAQDLLRYDLLIYPHMTIVDESFIPALTDYVRQGGRLLIGARSGYKEITGRCTMDKLPGKLKSLTGSDVYEYTYISPDRKKVRVKWDEDELYAEVFADQLAGDIDDCKVVATYEEDYYKGCGALTKRDFGKGEVYHYGSAFNEEAVRLFFEKLGVINPYGDIFKLPESVEIAVRKKGDVRYAFILNYLDQEVSISLKKKLFCITLDCELEGSITLLAYGVLVFKL